MKINDTVAFHVLLQRNVNKSWWLQKKFVEVLIYGKVIKKHTVAGVTFCVVKDKEGYKWMFYEPFIKENLITNEGVSNNKNIVFESISAAFFDKDKSGNFYLHFSKEKKFFDFVYHVLLRKSLSSIRKPKINVENDNLCYVGGDTFYRNVITTINKDNYHIQTKAFFNCFVPFPIEETKNIIFEKLIKKYNNHYKSASGSRYVVDEEGVYRFSNHWGNVASCYWGIDKVTGGYTIGYCKFEDMQPIASSPLYDEKSIECHIYTSSDTFPIGSIYKDAYKLLIIKYAKQNWNNFLKLYEKEYYRFTGKNNHLLIDNYIQKIKNKKDIKNPVLLDIFDIERGVKNRLKTIKNDPLLKDFNFSNPPFININNIYIPDDDDYISESFESILDEEDTKDISEGDIIVPKDESTRYYITDIIKLHSDYFPHSDYFVIYKNEDGFYDFHLFEETCELRDIQKYFDELPKIKLRDIKTITLENAKESNIIVPVADSFSSLFEFDFEYYPPYQVNYREVFPKVDETNYYLATWAVFKKISDTTDKDILQKQFNDLREKHGNYYKSGYNSQYVIGDGGVYRLSDHWGRGVASCQWYLAYKAAPPIDDDNKGLSVYNTLAIGFCKFSDFKPVTRNHTGDLYKITSPDLLKVIQKAFSIVFNNIALFEQLSLNYEIEDFVLQGMNKISEVTRGLYRSHNKKVEKYYLGGKEAVEGRIFEGIIGNITRWYDIIDPESGLKASIHFEEGGSVPPENINKEMLLKLVTTPYLFINKVPSRDDMQYKAIEPLEIDVKQITIEPKDVIKISSDGTKSMSVLDAIKVLSFVCDGAIAKDDKGFNKPDVFLNSMAFRTALTKAEQQSYKEIVEKYKKTQLGVDELTIEDYGLSDKEIIKKSKEETFISKMYFLDKSIVFNDDQTQVLVSFKFDKDYGYSMVGDLKKVPHLYRKFRNEDKTWVISLNNETINPLIDFLNKYKFNYNKNVLRNIAEKVKVKKIIPANKYYIDVDGSCLQLYSPYNKTIVDEMQRLKRKVGDKYIEFVREKEGKFWQLCLSYDSADMIIKSVKYLMRFFPFELSKYAKEEIEKDKY